MHSSRKSETMVRDLARAMTDTGHACAGVKLACKDIAWIKKYLEEEAVKDERTPVTFTVTTTHPAMTNTRGPSAPPPSTMAPNDCLHPSMTPRHQAVATALTTLPVTMRWRRSLLPWLTPELCMKCSGIPSFLCVKCVLRCCSFCLCVTL